MGNLAKEAMDFVRNNCMTWCNFDGCSTRECEKLNNKNMNELEITDWVKTTYKLFPLDSENELRIEIQDGDSDIVGYLNEDQARQIVKHLYEQFGTLIKLTEDEVVDKVEYYAKVNESNFDDYSPRGIIVRAYTDGLREANDY